MADARDLYLMESRLPTVLDAILEGVLALKPKDPIRYAISQLCAEEKERRKEALDKWVDRKAPTQQHPADTWNFPDLTGRHNIMAKVLTPELYSSLCHLRTSHGGEVDNVIQVGVDVREYIFSHSCGAVATDDECYSAFRPLLHPIIKLRHPEWKGSHPASDLDATYLVGACTFRSDSVERCHVRTCRSVAGIAFPSFMKRGDRRLVREAVEGACRTLAECGLKGRWYAVPDLPDQGDVDDVDWSHLCPKAPASCYDRSIALSRDWPDGRGVWLSDTRDLAVWTNVYEHVEVRAVAKSGKIHSAIDTCYRATAHLHKALADRGSPFACDDELGFLNSNPANLGNAVTLSVAMCLPNLCSNRRFDDVLREVQCTVLMPDEYDRATYFGIPETDDAVHPRLSAAATNCTSGNRQCWVTPVHKMGVTETKLVEMTSQAVARLLEIESLLNKDHSINVVLGL